MSQKTRVYPTGKTRTWDGGYQREGVYYIRRQVAGRRYELSTGCTQPRAALAHLTEFEVNPGAYAAAVVSKPAVPLSDALIERFLTWSRVEKHNSERWVYNQHRSLIRWQKALSGKDLRACPLPSLLTALDGMAGRAQMIRVLKTLYSWLCLVTHQLSAAEDPTYHQLTAPQNHPAQNRRSKAINDEQLKAILGHTRGVYRAALTILGASGWHFSELLRFAKGGSVLQTPQGAYVLAVPCLKSGAPGHTEVPAEVVPYAHELLAHGTLNYNRFREHLKQASQAAGVSPVLRPGYLRHTVATHAVNHGASVAAVSSFLNHRSERTTKLFYATHAVPARVPTPLT